MKNILTKNVTKFILTALFMTIVFGSVNYIPVHALTYDGTFAAGDIVNFYLPDYSSKYEWTITSGEDCGEIISGEDTDTCTVKFIKTGNVTISGRNSMRSGSWYSPRVFEIKVIDPSKKSKNLLAEAGGLGQTAVHYAGIGSPNQSAFIDYEWKIVSGSDCVDLVRIPDAPERKSIHGVKAGKAVVQVIGTLKDYDFNLVPERQYITTFYVTVKPSSSSSGSSNSNSNSNSKSNDIYDNPFCPTCNGTGDCPDCLGSKGTYCSEICLECTYGYNKVKTATGTKDVRCVYCKGSGICSKCKGQGRINCTRCSGTGTCPTCKGARKNPYYKGYSSSSKNSSTGTKTNPLTIKVSSKTYKRSKLTKKKTFKIGVSKAKGKVTYTLNKKAKKAKIKVSKKGKVTIPKKCKKGTYKITVLAAGNATYKAGKKIVTIKIK